MDSSHFGSGGTRTLTVLLGGRRPRGTRLTYDVVRHHCPHGKGTVKPLCSDRRPQTAVEGVVYTTWPVLGHWSS